MADSIKIGSLDISAFKVGSSDCKVYLGDTLLYPTTPPVFQGKWLATYTGGTTSSAECDSTSAITHNEITSADLISVEIGDCVTSIANTTFYGCSSLTSINIPSSVTSIGYYAFEYCTSLTRIEIPSGVTSISKDAFTGCEGLSSVTCLATTPPQLVEGTFNDTNNCPILVPSQSVEAYKSASGWSTYASRIQAIPNS
jgi:surface protein